MQPVSRDVFARPQDGAFADYATADIDRVPSDDAVEILTAQARDTVALLEPLGETEVNGLTYAPGKWTLKEGVGHLFQHE